MSDGCVDTFPSWVFLFGVLWTAVATFVRLRNSVINYTLTSCAMTVVAHEHNNASQHMENVASLDWPMYRD